MHAARLLDHIKDIAVVQSIHLLQHALYNSTRKRGCHLFREVKGTQVLAKQLVEGTDDRKEALRTTKIIKSFRANKTNQQHQLIQQQRRERQSTPTTITTTSTIPM